MPGNDLKAALAPITPDAGAHRVGAATVWAGLQRNDWSSWALLVNGALLVLYLALVPFRPAPGYGLIPVDQLTDLLLALALELQLVLALVAWRASTAPGISRRSRLGWRFFALACLAYWLGNLWYAYLEIVLQTPPFPSLADAGYLAFYPLAFAGLLCFTESSDSRRDRAQFWLDAITVAVGIATVVWYFLVQPLADVRFNNTLERLLTAAYPVGDALLLFGVTVLLLRYRHGRSGRPLAWLVAGLLMHFVADTSFAYQTLQGTYLTSGVTGGLYNTAYFLMLVGAHLEYRTPIREAQGRIDPHTHRFRHLAYVAIAVAYALLLYVSRDQWHTPLGGLIIAAIALTALVVARQVLSSQENARLRGEQAARETEARFSTMVRHSSDVISLLGPELAIRFVSPAAERVYGHAPDSLLDTSLLELIHPDDRSRAQRFLMDVLTHATGTTSTAEWRLRHSDGRWREIETIATNLVDDPAVGGVVLNSRDVTERRQLEERLRQMAFHDPLTRLANRTLLRDRVQHALQRTSRNRESVTLLFLDLDNFKAVNDSIGHAQGDVLLKETAARLLECSRQQDTVARLGGDEFAILIEDPLSTDGVIKLAERIAAALARPIALSGREMAISASIGIAQGSGNDVDALLRNADVAMYTVKNNGKRGFALFEPGMHAAVVERVDLEADFSKALERKEFRLLYQPIVDLETDSFAGVEALLRWHHPVRGVVPPSTFIPLAEEDSGLIVPLGRWVLREACRQGRVWQDLLPPGARLHIAINISVKQLQHSNLVQDVADALAECGLNPGYLVLEITESTLMQRTDLMLRTLSDLRASGVRMAIDDFGMGYSSLSYLHRFPVDILKIDKSFIDHLGQGAEGGGLTPAIIALADSMRLQTVAEGVEHASQAAELLRLGCRLAQGYHFSMPIRAEEIDAKWLRLKGQ